MTPTQVESLAERNGTSSFRHNAEQVGWVQPTEYLVSERATGFRLWFFDSQLRAYQQSRRSGPQSVDTSPPWDVCADRESGLVELDIDAPLDLAGALIYLDGLMIGELSDLSSVKNRGAKIKVPGLAEGEHEIVVDNGRGDVMRLPFKYERRVAWPARDLVEIRLVRTSPAG